MQIGICADPAAVASLPSPLAFDFIEGHVQKFLRPEAPDADWAPLATALRRCPRTMPAANCFLPPDLKITGPAVDHARLMRYATTAFRRAQEVGLTLIVLGSAGARMVPKDFSIARGVEQYTEALRLLAPLAAQHGVTLVVEPLNRVECNVVNTIVEGAAVVRQVGSPAVQLLVDIFHMLRNGESPDDIVPLGPLIRHAHVAENKNRAAPGVNGEDLRPFYRALKKSGYAARLTIEADWTDFPREVGPALAALRRDVTDAGF